MAAIEYGSYYWCVELTQKDQQDVTPGEFILLHADEMSIDPVGTLVFKSAGRRPAGAEPKQAEEKASDQKDSSKDGDKEKDGKDKEDKDKQSKKEGSMIYMAFAPGTWRFVYAAKLQDGSPASVEHWNSRNGTHGVDASAPPNAGAVGYPARA